MTNYLSLFKQDQKIIFDLGNLISDVYTAAFNVTLTAAYFTADDSITPADLILPISARESAQNMPSVFTVPPDTASNDLTLPRNTKKAVFTVAATGQSDEEVSKEWIRVPCKPLPSLSLYLPCGTFESPWTTLLTRRPCTDWRSSSGGAMSYSRRQQPSRKLALSLGILLSARSNCSLMARWQVWHGHSQSSLVRLREIIRSTRLLSRLLA